MRGDGTLDDARGLRQILAGTGGRGGVGYDVRPRTDGRLAVSADNLFGVLELELRHSSYRWEFVPAAPATYSDAGSASCG